MSHERNFLSRCKSCGGDIAWVRTRAREGKPSRPMPVQIMRKDGTATHPDDTFAQGTHAPHWSVCPYADSHRSKRIGRIAAQAEAQRPPESPPKPPPPPVEKMSDPDLRGAAAWYRGRKKRGPEQDRRLAEIEAELDRRRVDALPPRTVEDFSEQ